MDLVLVLLCTMVLGAQAIPIPDKEASDDPLQGNIHETIYKVNKNDDLRLFEADIVPSRLDQLSNIESAINKRNAVRDRKRLWLNKVIPYEFSYGFPGKHKNVVMEAIAIYHNETCLRFKPRTNEKQWIVFVNKKGCWSAVGRSYWSDGIGQELSLGNGCYSVGTALHEIMHALGFWHEQSRPDRNQYVEVLWENIVEDEAYNFNKYSHGVVDTLKIPYDFDSIMHYGTGSFSKNGRPTIRSIRKPDRNLGQKSTFTSLDKQELNALYDCKESSSSWSSWSHYGPCSLFDCTKYRQRFCTSDNPSVDCKGADYYGVQTKISKCSDEECHAPIDGHWARWSSWSSCSASCGFGNQTRTRICADPKPQFNGKNCVGSSTGYQRCKQRTCGLGPDDCEFDSDGLCHWTIDKSNKDYIWSRVTGVTPSSGTGPSGDHTSKTGFYLYTEGSGPASTGDKARLISKKLPASEVRCLSFWYHMYGDGIGSLSVIMKDTRGEQRIWEESGNKGKEWNIGHVNVESNSNYQVIFESVRGNDFRSDIAIDDVKFDDGPCVEEVGCFSDDGMDRTFPDLYANLRPNIDWFNMRKIVVDCAKRAYKKHYKIYGVQFYGECWGGNPRPKYYILKNDPDKCWNGVGRGFANFVYKIV